MMRMLSALLTLFSQWLRCALQVLLITSVLFTGILPVTTAQELAGSEETNSPVEEQEEKKQEEEKEELAKFSEQQGRSSKGNLRRWHDGDCSASAYGTGPRHAVDGHCLANGLRAPLLH